MQIVKYNGVDCYEFKTGEKAKLSDHFSSDEFECGGNKDLNYIAVELINKLEELRDAINMPLYITSAYRTLEHQIELVKTLPVGQTVKNSAHTLGLAADVHCKDMFTLYKLALNIFNNIGDGRKLGFVHVDVRPKKPDGTKRLWNY